MIRAVLRDFFQLSRGGIQPLLSAARKGNAQGRTGAQGIGSSVWRSVRLWMRWMGLSGLILASLLGAVRGASAQDLRFSTGSVHAEPVVGPDGGPALGTEPWSHDVGGLLTLGLPVSDLFDFYGGLGFGTAVSLEVGAKVRPWRGHRLEPYLQAGYGRYEFDDLRTSVIPLGLGLQYRLNDRTGVFFEVEHRWSALQFPPGVELLDPPIYDPPEVESSITPRIGLSVGLSRKDADAEPPSPPPMDPSRRPVGVRPSTAPTGAAPAPRRPERAVPVDTVYTGRFGETRFDPNRHEGMILLPDGIFIMGLMSEDPLALQRAGRKHVTVNAFYIDRYEVSNADYRAYLDALPPLEREAALPDSLVWTEARSQESWRLYFRGRLFADYPVIGVDWDQAERYCQAQGKRLPTEAEWEYAARAGHMGSIYPWDGFSTRDEQGRFLANYQPREGYPADGYAFTAPVHAFPPNDWGLFHMVGNVAEWTRDAYTPSYSNISDFNPYYTDENEPRRVVRGGSWASSAYFIGVGVRSTQPKGEASVNIGFRCVREVSSEDVEPRLVPRTQPTADDSQGGP